MDDNVDRRVGAEWSGGLAARHKELLARAVGILGRQNIINDSVTAIDTDPDADVMAFQTVDG